MSAAAAMSAGPEFVLPSERAATSPPEARGLARDEVRLLVATAQRVEHARFRALATHLRAGDLLVVNTSATLPAALDGLRVGQRPVTVHVAGPHPDDPDAWIVELRRTDGHGPERDGRPGEVVHLPGEVALRLVAAHPDLGLRLGSRLWRAHPDPPPPHVPYLLEHGRPITYGYLAGRWPLETYQPVHAREPGSAEMASAGRPFTERLLVDLVAHTRRAGGRIVAVGTTATRALESVASPAGHVRAGAGWTDLVLSRDRPARVVNGLITGWHEPGASHLTLLEAVAGHDLVERAYAEALAGDYLWHEFGDSCLLLP